MSIPNQTESNELENFGSTAQL